jgi:hypothetical protein
MKTEYKVPLDSFLTHGQVRSQLENDALKITTDASINTRFQVSDTPIQSYAFLPDKVKLPFSIDMTVQIDSPALYLIVGKGHIGFGTGMMDNRRITDILGGDYKPNSHVFENDIPIGRLVDLSVVYGKKAMWVLIDHKLCCCSKNDKYIKTKELPEEFKDGFGIGIACDKRTVLTVKSFMVTAYENEEPVAPAEPTGTLAVQPICLTGSEKPTVEQCVQGLSPSLKEEVLRTDEYLMKVMKKSLKLSRKIEGGYPCSRITYVSDWGFRYKVQISGGYVWHDINWISYNTKREQEKVGGYKKADYTIETLEKLAEESPEFAEAMFSRIKECVACCGENGCFNKALYEYGGQKKAGCGWSDGMQFKMFPSDFGDVRNVVGAIHAVLVEVEMSEKT